MAASPTGRHAARGRADAVELVEVLAADHDGAHAAAA
jgi:hypothetical protein